MNRDGKGAEEDEESDPRGSPGSDPPVKDGADELFTPEAPPCVQRLGFSAGRPSAETGRGMVVPSRLTPSTVTQRGVLLPTARGGKLLKGNICGPLGCPDTPPRFTPGLGPLWGTRMVFRTVSPDRTPRPGGR